MKLAVMQPYLFPYIGYFQLINAVDKFVVYDDVNFIKQGWINRNNILASGKPLLFSAPLKNQSSFQKINETELNERLYDSWAKKFLKTIEQNYKKAPHFETVFPLLKEVLETEEKKIAQVAVNGLRMVVDYLGIDTEIVDSSVKYHNQELHSQARILDICALENASQYINLSGGMALYSKEDFAAKGIALHFIQNEKITYRQFTDDFVPNLSIIDILMFNNITEIQGFLNQYKLL
ncbi:WbqC family protein [Flavobacterium sp. XGLA_31]|uniref:WbqC family protein n=1 Tax=Flavobacterium sp. XGLA_31 TaxID=3447666 RepID=UPI003F313D8B